MLSAPSGTLRLVPESPSDDGVEGEISCKYTYSLTSFLLDSFHPSLVPSWLRKEYNYERFFSILGNFYNFPC